MCRSQWPGGHRGWGWPGPAGDTQSRCRGGELLGCWIGNRKVRLILKLSPDLLSAPLHVITNDDHLMMTDHYHKKWSQSLPGSPPTCWPEAPRRLCRTQPGADTVHLEMTTLYKDFTVLKNCLEEESGFANYNVCLSASSSFQQTGEAKSTSSCWIKERLFRK